MASAMFTQRASGKASLPVDPAACCHCGIDSGTLNLSYSICLVWQCDSLNPQGFLIDNLAFASYWQDRVQEPLTVSCEHLCQQVCHYFLALGGERMVSCSVELSPFNGVAVEYSCRND